MALLEVRNIGISFGGLKAVNDFSLTIEKRAALRSDWTEWSWKNNGIQSAHWRV